MLRLTELAHRLIREVVAPGDWVVDATLGNGHDTVMLAEAVGASGHVIGFDVQADALAITRARLRSAQSVTLHLRGHEHLEDCLPAEARNQLAAVMFNLGYLPGAEKATVTRAETTLAALVQAVAHLRIGGRITAMLYTGHPGGTQETLAVRAFASALPPEFVTTLATRLNAVTVPELVLIERVR